MLSNPISHYEISSGRYATIRPVKPEDAPLILDMYGRLSEASIYRRFLRHYTVTLEDVQAESRVNEGDGAGFVAVIDDPRETVIGLAYYAIDDKESGASAEPALLVEDRFQGMGLGRHLARTLAEYAVSQGLYRFNAYLHPMNDAVLKIIRRSGLEFESQVAYGMHEVQIALMPQHEAEAEPEIVEEHDAVYDNYVSLEMDGLAF
jgi:acetyltransferase